MIKHLSSIKLNCIGFRHLSILTETTVGATMSSNNDPKDNEDKNGKENLEPSTSTGTGTEEHKSDFLETIRHYFAEKLHLYSSDDEQSRPQVLDSVNIDGVIKHWKKGGFKKIVTMVGAGISTAAGIPDFRSPKSGLYHNLMKFNLPYPEAIFDLDYFKENPQPFFKLAKELYPGSFKPTVSHYFIKLLDEKGLLLRHYSQNIDTLERIAEITPDKLVECHGTFFTNHCLCCKKSYSMEWVKEQIFKDNVPTCTVCNAVVKPDIVFFGENLPEKFYTLPNMDFKECDLLIIMGTSLTVQPFASLVDYVSDNCVRLLINRDKVGKHGYNFFRSMLLAEGLCFDLPGNRRDVAYETDCDTGCQYIADQLGFGEELRELVKREHKRIDQESNQAQTGADGNEEETKEEEKSEDGTKDDCEEKLLAESEKDKDKDV